MISISTLSNGLTVIIEEIPHVESAAYELNIPGGIICDRADRLGASLIVGELVSRGAGNFDSRQLSDAFEDLGIRHSEGANHDRYVFRGSLLSDNLDTALHYVSLMVRSPRLPEDEVDDIKNLLLQDIRSLDDSPSRRVMVELAARYYPDPFSRPSMGSEAGITATTYAELKELWQTSFKPGGAVLSIAGKVNTAAVLDSIHKHFSEWQGKGHERPAVKAFPPTKVEHIAFDSAQLQIGMAYPSTKFGAHDYYTAKVAGGLLSGGMFGRLFIEVREKRGLCYSVYARHSATKEYGVMMGYAGTTPERAQETLDVMVSVLRTVKGTIEPEELVRSKADIKSSLVIGEESSGSRASSNAGDWWVAKRVRTLEEIQQGLDKVTIKDLDAFFEDHPAKSVMIVTLGSKNLEMH